MMIDFHSHVLPGIDDGSDSVITSLAMLAESHRQGVERIYATPHFYASENDPESFLRNRSRAFKRLKAAMERSHEKYPELLLGAEILYFPGMSVAEELKALTMERTSCLLIELPLTQWTDFMLDEIEQTGDNLRCIPVLAHVDRYMRYLNDFTLIDRVRKRRMLVQVNASFFINEKTRAQALDALLQDKFQFIGSDCHNMTRRRPNMGLMSDIIDSCGAGEQFQGFCRRLEIFTGRD